MSSTNYGRRIVRGVGLILLGLIVGVFILSFFLDEIISPAHRARDERETNGYHTTLPHAHLQLLGGRLTLRGLKIIQEHHPTPPVAHVETMQFRIQWRELLTGHVVADVLLVRPHVRIDTAQFQAEKQSNVPLRQKGWQDALENVYPFKINKFQIRDGDVVYVDANDPHHPLHLRSSTSPPTTFVICITRRTNIPRRYKLRAIVFEQGTLEADGKANFLAEPYPGVRVSYRVSDIPLNAVTPAAMNVNLVIHGGVLGSQGVLEYAPKIARVEVDDAPSNVLT